MNNERKTDKKIRGWEYKHLLDGGGWSGSLTFFDRLAYVCWGNME